MVKVPEVKKFYSREKCLKLTWNKSFLLNGKEACPGCGSPAKQISSPHGGTVYVHKERREA